MKSVSEGRVLALEQKYVDLLERRVAELEARLASNSHQTEIHAAKIIAESKKLTETKSAESSTSSNKDEAETREEVKEEDENAVNTANDAKRHRIVINSLDPETREYVDKAPTAAAKAISKTASKISHRAFTFRKFLRNRTSRGEQVLRANGSQIDVESEPLQKLLAKITRKFDTASKVSQMDSPFQNLVWSWSIAEQEANNPDPNDSDETKEARDDLRALLDIISTSSGDEFLDRYFESRDHILESRQVGFESLWTLFPKGTYILSWPVFNKPQVFLVQSCEIPDMDESDPTLQVVAYSYDWNGERFNRVPYLFNIDSYSDKKGILELPFYPLDDYRKPDKSGPGNATDVEDLKKQLVARGEKYYNYCTAEQGKQTFSYNGRAYRQRGAGLFRTSSINDDAASYTSRSPNEPSDSASAPDKTSSLKGLVVVDFMSYYEYRSTSDPIMGELQKWEYAVECSCTECRQSFESVFRYSWDGLTGRDRHRLTPEQYMMFPPRVLGYSLGQKQWVQLEVDGVDKPTTANRANFDDKLILDQKNKELVRKSVQAHGRKNIKDYTPGKGKGLVILLWGVPGVGKTLTAESVAALAGKPLFSIGVSDIGVESTMVETNLQKVFALASLWGAVLLFDEADVFLEARDTLGSDMQRNTMVSVLLRVLEYYEGILILTTNRLKTFDIAVQSRIHICIEYHDLSPDQRNKIFQEFLGQLKKEDLVDDWGGCITWVQEEGQEKMVNGRQIRNIVSTAMGLAHAENRGLRRTDLSEVARNTEIFSRALAEQDAVYRNNQIKEKR